MKNKFKGNKSYLHVFLSIFHFFFSSILNDLKIQKSLN